MTDYIEALTAFVETVNKGLLAATESDYEPVEISLDGYTVFDCDNDDNIYIPGRVVYSTYWIDGDPNSEYISVPEPLDRESYLRICQEIIDKSFWYQIYLVRLEHCRQQLEKYCIEFGNKLKNEWKLFQQVSLEGLPIHITSGDAKDREGRYDYKTDGRYRKYNGIISIYQVSPDHIDDAKQTARHELIHYFLDSVHLDCHDNSGLFWFFADLYDAHPYAKLDDYNKAIYDGLTGIFRNENGKEDIDNALLLYLKKDDSEK